MNGKRTFEGVPGCFRGDLRNPEDDSWDTEALDRRSRF